VTDDTDTVVESGPWKKYAKPVETPDTPGPWKKYLEKKYPKGIPPEDADRVEFIERTVRQGAGQVDTAVKKALGKARKHEPDIDYERGRTQGEVEFEQAHSPAGARKALEQYYPPTFDSAGKLVDNVGQDNQGRWWVRDKGQKVAVNPAFISKLMASAPATLGGVAGAAEGGEIGLMGGPLAPFTVPAGMLIGGGLGSMVGQGTVELTKLAGGRADSIQDTLGALVHTGAENAALSAIAPAGRAIGSGLGSWFRGKNVAEMTPETTARTGRLVRGGAIPAISSVAPGLKGFAAKQDLTHIVSGDAIMGQNVEYFAKRLEQEMQNAGMSPAQARDFVKRVSNPDSAVSQTVAGTGIVETALQRVATSEKKIQMNLELAKENVDVLEQQIRAWTSAAPKGLAEGVTNAFEKARSDFGVVMGKAYHEVHELTGAAPVVPALPTRDAALSVVQTFPPGQVPKLISDIAQGDKQFMTIEEAHNFRNTLRQMERDLTRGGNLTPGQAYAMIAPVEQALDNTFEQLAKNGTGLTKEAAKALAKVDAQYREGIPKFRNLAMRKLVRDAEDGIFSDPGEVAKTIMQVGQTEQAKTLIKLLPPELREGVEQAHFANLLRGATELDEATGRQVLNPKALLKKLHDLNDINSAIVDKATLKEFTALATQLAAVGGKIDATAMLHGAAPGQTLSRAAQNQLAQAVTEAETVDAFVKADPIGALASNKPQVVDAAVSRLTQAGDEATTLAAFHTLGRTSPVAQKLRETYWRQFFHDAYDKTPSGMLVMNGKAVQDKMKSLTKVQQELLFPNGMADAISLIADDVRFVFPKNVFDYAENQTAMNVKSKSYINPAGLSKRLSWFVWGHLVAENPKFLLWLADQSALNPAKEWRRKILGMYGRWIFNAIDDTGPKPATGMAPPVEGARQAPDGKFYISDPKRPGKYLRVESGAQPGADTGGVATEVPAQ